MIYTPSQRAMFAAKRANATKADGNYKSRINKFVDATVVPVSEAAAEVGVGTTSVTVAKRLRREAAPEIVRRAERCMGLAIRKGQEEGRIGKPGDQRSESIRDQRTANTLIAPGEFAGEGHTRSEIYAMADGISDKTFEKALTEAKSEKNLSRANVVRKVKGENPRVDRWAPLAGLAARDTNGRDGGTT